MGRSLFCILTFTFACALLGGCSGESSTNTVVEDVSPVAGEGALLPFVGGSSVVFTEIDPTNLVYEDHEGGDAGWVELYNASDTAVNLSGLSLTDSQEVPQKWSFGNVVVQPRSFMLVFLSGKDLPDFEAPHDSTDMIGPGCWTWVDADNDPPGYSYADPLQGKSDNCYKENGVKKVGAVMKYGENEVLGWHSISLFVGTGNSSKTDVTDISSANEILLTGLITKGAKLSVRLAQPDLDDWKGYEIVFEGTGDPNTTYSARLPVGTDFPDLANIYGTRISPQEQEMGEVVIDVSKYIVRNRGHEPHANFKSKKKGGSLYLVRDGKYILDSLKYPGDIPIGKSWGIGTTSAGVDVWGYGNSSPYGFSSTPVTPSISPSVAEDLPPSGFYSEPFEVRFDASKNVHCSQGGYAPTMASPLFGELMVNESVTLRCASFEPGSEPGKIESRTYIFEPQPSVATVFLVGDPLSFFDPDTGIYSEGPNAQSADPHYGANYWADRELPVHVELFEPGEKTPAFSEEAGYQIFGNYSRMQNKKSVAITFREKYGKNRLEYPLFPEFPELKKFKVFLLRNNGGNFGNDYIHDMLASSLTEGLGLDYQRGRAAVVFYNNEYYGIHNIRERSTEYYFETHYGYDPEDIDLLKADNSATNGSSVDYVALMDWLETHSLESAENYAYMESQIDVGNFMNYVLAEIFIDNRDWPGNNLKKWRNNNPKTLWKWFIYDMDFGLDNGYSDYTNNIFEFATDSTETGWPNGSEYTLLLRRLLGNEGFRTAFVNRMTTLLSTNFESSRILSRIDVLMYAINGEIARDQKRWKLNATRMENTLNTIRNFARTRQGIIMQEMSEFFGLGAPVEVSLATDGNGQINVHGLPIDRNSVKVNFFNGLNVTITAQPLGGSTFVGWSDGETSPTRVIVPEKGLALKAVFK